MTDTINRYSKQKRECRFYNIIASVSIFIFKKNTNEKVVESCSGTLYEYRSVRKIVDSETTLV